MAALSVCALPEYFQFQTGGPARRPPARWSGPTGPICTNPIGFHCCHGKEMEMVHYYSCCRKEMEMEHY
jgi:hypothetical protein